MVELRHIKKNSFYSSLYEIKKNDIIIPIERKNIMGKAKVYFIREITPDNIIKIYETVGKKLEGNVAVKMHSGEQGNQNYLRADFVKDVIKHVNGTVVECNTAYPGARNSTEKHRKLIEEHEWEKYFPFDLMDAEGDIELEVPNGKILKKNYVGENMAKYEELLNQYHEYAFNIYAANMYEESTGEDAEKFNMNEFNYYVRMYEMLEQCGGMGVAIEDFDGPYGDARNDAEWLTNMVQCGQMSIMTVNYDKKTKEITLKGCSVGADTDLKYTTTTEIDKVALAKAEAKYEHDLKLIDKKDKQLDLSLSKLETERNALKTEYDSVKKVIQDNIDRTFGIFS